VWSSRPTPGSQEARGEEGWPSSAVGSGSLPLPRHCERLEDEAPAPPPPGPPRFSRRLLDVRPSLAPQLRRRRSRDKEGTGRRSHAKEGRPGCNPTPGGVG
jgi:hypothetical protein